MSETRRNNAELGIGGIALVRNYDHRRKNLSHTTKYVLLVLASHCADKDFTWIGDTRLMMECGFKKLQTVGEHLRLLEKADLITKTDPGKGPRLKTLNWDEIRAGQMPQDIIHDLPEVKMDDEAEIAAQAVRDASYREALKNLPTPLPQWLTQPMKLDDMGLTCCPLTGNITNTEGQIGFISVNAALGHLKWQTGTSFKEFKTINAELEFRRALYRAMAKHKVSQDQFTELMLAADITMLLDRAHETTLLTALTELMEGKSFTPEELRGDWEGRQ